MQPEPITVKTTVRANIQRVWECWTSPEHIVKWNFASDDWHCPAATNDLQPGGRLCATMASRDGKMSFEFEGVYREVSPPNALSFVLGDGRAVVLHFSEDRGVTTVTETFDPENENPREMQQEGWQAILENFRKHVENH